MAAPRGGVAEGLQGMTRVEVPRGEDLVLVLKGTREFRETQPELFGGLVDSTANVNRLKSAYPDATRLLLRYE